MKKNEGWSISDAFLSALRGRKVKKYILPNSVLCDIGCGTGKLLKSLAHDIDKGIGIDKDIQSTNFNNLEFYNLDFDNMPVPLDNESCDCVLMLAVIEHLNKPVNIIEEIYRILKAKGILLLTTPSPSAKSVLEFLAYKLRIISKNSVAEHIHYFTKQELIELLTEAGFNIDRISVVSFQAGFNIFVRATK